MCPPPPDRAAQGWQIDNLDVDEGYAAALATVGPVVVDWRTLAFERR